ncbi:MAG: PLP-dependent aminotransferase family protein [Chloroflexota bacterium]
MDIPLRVDTTSSAPRHRQVYDSIRSAILTGRLRPGDRLPPTRALATQLSVSRTTVTEAYDQLRAEGYADGRLGSGTYVSPNLPEDGLHVASRPEGRRHTGAETLKLSRWGRCIVGDEYRGLLKPDGDAEYRFDFRPQGVAHDGFPWDAWESAVDRASRERSRLMLYPPSAGHPALREAIAAHVAAYRAVECSPENIVVVNGSLQGMNLLAQLLLDAGERVAVEDPGYPAVRLAFEATGLVVDRVPVDGDGMIVDLLDELGPHRMVHVTPSHQLPTGATLSLARRLALLDHAERSGCVVLEDDYDSEFRYDGRPVESLQGLDRTGLVVYAGTFSKSVLAGLRIGFLVLPDQLVGAVVAAKSLWDSGAPMLEQGALAQFMRNGDFERHIRRMRRLYRTRRDALVGALSDTFGSAAAVGEHHGGLNLLVTLNWRLSEDDVIARAHAVGVGLRGASSHYSVPPPSATLLLGFGALPEEDIRQGVRLLGSVLGVSGRVPAA